MLTIEYSMRLKTKSLKFNSVLVKAKTNEILAQTFMRFQEYYESPKFKNTIFTIGQFKKWYSETYGSDSYHNDWTGFNFPSYVLIPFRQGLFDPLTTLEQELLNLFKYRHDNFYIIGANDDAVIRHELSHALFAQNHQYKIKVNHLCKTYKKKLKIIKDYILDKGYHPDVINDEIQAYITDNDDKFIINNIDQVVINKFNKLYSYYNKQLGE